MSDVAPPAADAPPPVPLGKREPPGEPGSPAAPAVVAVIVTHDPGPWFEEVLRSFAAQTYEALSVLVVDTASAEDPSARVAAVLPDARIKRLDHDPGFGAAANQVLDLVEGAAFHLLCHDDVALARGAVRALVEEAFRTNGGVLGPKLVDWHDPRRIRSVGGAIDKTGVPAPSAEPGELDQEQHDAVRDVFYVAGGVMLVRADLFATLGGFDPGMTFHGEDVDLCWRAHVVGARVLVVPSARVRHLEALATRRPVDDRRRLQQRHRVRSLLSCYRWSHLVRVVPQALVLAVIEAVGVLVTGRVRHAADVAGAWTWNLRRIGALRRRRRAIARSRAVPDAEVRELQVRGSARLTAFLRGQVGSADDRLAALAATGRDLTGTFQAPLTRIALGAVIFTLGLVAIGSRNLIFEPLPAVGEMAAVPASALDLLRDHLSGWRSTGGGGPGASPTGVGALGLGGLLSLGATGVARKLLVFGLIAAGPVGIWRLSRPIGSIRAGAAAVVVYAAIPVPYNALSHGTLSALAAYAVIPWVLLGLGRTMALAPFGKRDLPEDADVVIDSVTSAPARALGIGVALALGATVTPAIIPLAGVVLVGLVVGSLVAGRTAGLLKAVGATLGGVVVAVVLHLPWSATLLLDGGGWAAVVGADQTAVRPIGELLRFQTGPYGNTPLGWAFLVAAALPLVIGRGWRLAWAIRAWFVALACWTVLLLAERGALPFDLPPAEVLLVPAAAALAFSAALGMAAFEVDLRHFQFGWRQAASIVAAVAVLVGGLTLAPGVFDGRWKVPKADLNRFAATPLTADGDRDARILWLGDPEVMPLGAHRYDDDVALATSDGLPDVTSLWAGRRHESTERLIDLVGLGADGRTAHLGELLGPEGVRYIMVPTRSVPEAYDGVSAPPPRWLTDMLDAQLDLQRVVTDRSLLVYRNTAWRGMAHTLVPSAQLPDEPAGAVDVDLSAAEGLVTARPEHDRYRLEVPADSDVVAAVPSEGWELDVDGSQEADGEVFGWAARFAEPGAGTGTLSYRTPATHLALVLVQPVLWAVALLARRRILSGARRRAAAAAAPPPAPAPVVDPVEAAAAAVAGLAERATAATSAATDAPPVEAAGEGDAGRRGRRRRRKEGER
ncbi:glycosyltransferase family 2 protein [Iamia sp. SCSIO 61187]|uniref:glycosyltransferase family 2 protein n=1 Tax=Iamia sp. SCSIO 61187 TaxID=2722752 RepID=UPI001C62DEEE|nr:glycosyltransferase family 2 protein [Iamia sp. SCSIO 61187]QYG93955.1 glycosyltransferase family 2 protein [Iamia sp. SCSIO 61187]